MRKRGQKQGGSGIGQIGASDGGMEAIVGEKIINSDQLILPDHLPAIENDIGRFAPPAPHKRRQSLLHKREGIQGRGFQGEIDKQVGDFMLVAGMLRYDLIGREKRHPFGFVSGELPDLILRRKKVPDLFRFEFLEVSVRETEGIPGDDDETVEFIKDLLIDPCRIGEVIPEEAGCLSRPGGGQAPAPPGDL